jgi:DNA-binding MarR family transcriptional regulator
MPRARRHPDRHQAAERLVRTAPLVSRWIERVLAAHDPPFTVAQYLALQAIGDGEIVGAELARRAAVSPAAVSQLLAALESAGMLTRDRLADDRRRQPLALTEQGRWTLHSAQIALRERLAGLLADMPPAETDALARLLERLELSLSGTPPPPRPPRPEHGPKRRKRP